MAGIMKHSLTRDGITSTLFSVLNWPEKLIWFLADIVASGDNSSFPDKNVVAALSCLLLGRLCYQ